MAAVDVEMRASDVSEQSRKTISLPSATEVKAPQAGFEARGADNLSYFERIYEEYKQPQFHQSLLAEFVATAIFTFFLIMSCLPEKTETKDELWRVALTAGFMIGAVVYCFYAVSGGNVNPAVSWGLAAAGRMTPSRALAYTVLQCVGAITGTAMAREASHAWFEKANGGVNMLADGVSVSQGFWAEFMGTLLLVVVVLFATDRERTVEHIHMTTFIPVAIGIAVCVDHFCLMPYTGCSVNPARSLGSAVLTGVWDHHWIWWCAPILGGVCGSVFYTIVFGPEICLIWYRWIIKMQKENPTMDWSSPRSALDSIIHILQMPTKDDPKDSKQGNNNV